MLDRLEKAVERLNKKFEKNYIKASTTNHELLIALLEDFNQVIIQTNYGAVGKMTNDGITELNNLVINMKQELETTITAAGQAEFKDILDEVTGVLEQFEVRLKIGANDLNQIKEEIAILAERTARLVKILEENTLNELKEFANKSKKQCRMNEH